MEEIVHFALNSTTACGCIILGSTIETKFNEKEEKEEVRNLFGAGKNVLHTCIPENVTCINCKNHQQFKNYLNILDGE